MRIDRLPIPESAQRGRYCQGEDHTSETQATLRLVIIYGPEIEDAEVYDSCAECADQAEIDSREIGATIG